MGTRRSQPFLLDSLKGKTKNWIPLYPWEDFLRFTGRKTRNLFLVALIHEISANQNWHDLRKPVITFVLFEFVKRTFLEKILIAKNLLS